MLRKHILVLLAILVGIIGFNPVTASADGQVCTTGSCQYKAATLVTDQGPTTTTTTTNAWKKAISSYEKTTKKTVVVWYSTKRLSTRGRKCYAVGKGTKYSWFWNSYISAATGKKVWFKDRRRSTLCGTGKGARRGKKLKRTACQNDSKLPRQPAPPKSQQVKHIKEFKSISEVKKFFTEEGTSTSTSTTTTTTQHYVCPEGWTKYVSESGVVMCKICPPPSCTPCPPGSNPNPDGTKCVKDGTTTPPPPTTAPGPNPPPSGGTGDPGSNKCYWESAGPNPDGTGIHASGDPVDPKYFGANGACPVGSFGA